MPVSYAFRTQCFWSAMRRGAAEALWRAEGFASLYLHVRRNNQTPNVETLPNFLYWAIGDERCKFLQRAEWRGELGESLLRFDVGGTRARECFSTGRFSSERAAVKGGSASLKTIIIAGGANIRQLQYTTQPGPKISGTGASIVS